MRERFKKISHKVVLWWNSKTKLKRILMIAGALIVLAAIIIGACLLWTKPQTKPGEIVSEEDIPQPLEKFEDYGLQIESLGISAPIIPNVDGLDEKIYYPALKKGVAQFKGSQNPDEKGNLFVFGHSSYFPGVVGTKFTEIFKKLNELKTGDKYIVFYKGTKYEYKVTKSYKTDDKDWSIMDPTPKNADDKSMTLMTCWPPGSDTMRWIITAEQTTN